MGYFPQAVTFGGTNERLTQASLTGQANSKLWTGSLWINPAADDTGYGLIYQFQLSGNVFNYVYKTSGNRIFIRGANTSGTQILAIGSTAGTVVAAGGWYHVLFSVDLADTGKRHLYINDAESLTDITAYTDDTIDFTLGSPGWFVGANGNDADRFNGDMCDVWLFPGVYIDFSVEANRRLFISSAGDPVDLGSDGSTPTGAAPLIFLSGATASWHTNKGTGGGFTENGTLTDAPSSPNVGVNADAGAYTISGQNAGTLVGRLPFAVDAGSYLLSGQSATLTFGKNIIAAVGSYILSGLSVVFPRTSSSAIAQQIPLVASSAARIFGVNMIQNFSMIAGDTRTLVVTVKDPDGDAVSITSATIKWHAARTSSRTAAITKTTGGSGIAITDGAGGIFTVTLDADDTEDLVGNFMHEAEITFADSSISTVLQGTMKINPRLIANAT